MLVRSSSFPAPFNSSSSLVLQAERPADLVDDVLVGSGVVAAGRFVAELYAYSQSASTSPPVRAGLLSCVAQMLARLRLAGAGRGRVPIEIEADGGVGGKARRPEAASLALQPGWRGRGPGGLTRRPGR